jgi:hypothetical protein
MILAFLHCVGSSPSSSEVGKRSNTLSFTTGHTVTVSLAYGRKATQLCIDVATEVVDAVETFRTSQRSSRCECHAFLHHLTGALVPMICIIVRQNNGEELTRQATNLLNKSLKIIESFLEGSFLARRILHQLRRPIKIARDVIESQLPQHARSSAALNATLSAGPVDLM